MATVESACGSSAERPVSTAARTFTPFSIEQILGLKTSASLQEEPATVVAATDCISASPQAKLQSATCTASSEAGSEGGPISFPVPWVSGTVNNCMHQLVLTLCG